MPHVILDRDGVINVDTPGHYIKSPQEWVPIPGSLEAIASLNRHGFDVFVATNQSGIARGYYTTATLHEIHKKFLDLLAQKGAKVEEIFFCPHHPMEHCPCRKPRPGMIEQIANKYAICLKETYFIGDSFVDIQAAQAAGCIPMLVLTGHGKLTFLAHPMLKQILHFIDLAAAVKYIIDHHLRKKEHCSKG